MAIRNFECLKKGTHSGYTDITASDLSNKKILLRSIEPQSKAGFVGVEEVKNMVKTMKLENYDSGILISSKFTIAAAEEMANEKIQLVSDDYMPHFGTEKIYLTITNCINNQCKAKCGKIPRKNSDCKQQVKGNLCKIKALSDNSSFHFEHGWIDLMKNDLKQLLALREAIQ